MRTSSTTTRVWRDAQGWTGALDKPEDLSCETLEINFCPDAAEAVHEATNMEPHKSFPMTTDCRTEG